MSSLAGSIETTRQPLSKAARISAWLDATRTLPTRLQVAEAEHQVPATASDSDAEALYVAGPSFIVEDVEDA